MEENVGDTGGNKKPPLTTLKDIFNEHLPFYLALGMSYELYYDGEPELVKQYREAFKLKQQLDNQNNWFIGKYIECAMTSVAPLINAFSGAKTWSSTYPNQPFPITEEEIEKLNQETVRKKYEGMKKYMLGE